MNSRYALPGALPPPRRGLRFVVAVPARNEAAGIEATLDALGAQRDRFGAALPPDSVETILFANGCRDDTAARARAWARRHPSAVVHVVEGDLPADRAHVGTARAAAMDAGARRLLSLGRPAATIATTDADSLVAPQWIAETERALWSAEAVGGRIYVAPEAAARLPRALVRAMEREERYRFAIARLEAFCDPDPSDPWPRHGQQFGASLALRAAAYVDAGGLPAVPCLEDVALYAELRRRDARFCHSLRVRVATSPRVDPRASGGFGTHLSLLYDLGLRGRSQHVEDPELTIARVRGRATFRRWWSYGARAATIAERSAACAAFAAQPLEADAMLAAATTFGAAFAELEGAGEARGAFRRPHVPVERATARLEGYASAFARANESSMPVAPARESAASGAG